MRVAVIAGSPGSGKTTLISRLLEHGFGSEKITVVLNNERSRDLLSNFGVRVDTFPFRSPCARSKQLMLKVSTLLSEESTDIMICEPPGNCIETSAPMLNPVYVSEENVSVAPLITVVDWSKKMVLSKEYTEGLRLRNMIDESDIVVLNVSDTSDVDLRSSIVIDIRSVNPDAEILFSDTDGVISRLVGVIVGQEQYHRALNN